MRQTLQHPVLQWLLVFLLLIVVRGNEGLNVPLSLDVNDTIVFSEIASNPSFPKESISAQYIAGTAATGITYLPVKLLRTAGLSAESQFLVLYVAQMAALAFGSLLFLRAFGTQTGFILLGVLLAFFSGFVGFGRYLALAAGFKIVTSGFALAVGLAILGLHLRGFRYAAAVTAALLAAYHPTHGLVLLAILGVYALWETFVRKTLDFKGLVQLGAATLAALLPFVFFVLLKIPATQAFDHEAWWLFVFNKTSNLTPLQDGIPVVAGIWSALLLGIVGLRAHARTAPHIADRCVIIIGTVLILWVVQITGAEIFRSVTVAQLALTRATPYAVMVIAALLAQRVYRAFTEGDTADKLIGLLLTLGAVGVALPDIIEPFGLPTFTPAIYATNWFYQGKVIDQSHFAVLSGALAWWLWLPYLDERAKRILTVAVAIALFIAVTLFGLRTSSLAAYLCLLVFAKSEMLSRFPVNKSMPVVLIGLSLTLLAFAQNPWKAERADKIVRLTKAIEGHVPEDGMILTLPANDIYGEALLPARATFLGWSESQYVIYAPPLIDEIWKRAALLGVGLDSVKKDCPFWLWKPMCRRVEFDRKASAENPVWRENIRKITAIAPVTHVLMPETMACSGDKPDARVDDMVLIPVRGLAPAGCGR